MAPARSSGSSGWSASSRSGSRTTWAVSRSDSCRRSRSTGPGTARRQRSPCRSRP